MTITTDRSGLSIILHGREQLWAVRAKVSVPRENIKSIRFEPSFRDWRKWEIRMPGASIPGHLVAGSYWTEEGWDFLYIKDPRGFMKPQADNVLVIETTENRFCRIILSYDPVEAAKIVKWWNKRMLKSKKFF